MLITPDVFISNEFIIYNITIDKIWYEKNDLLLQIPAVY